MHDANSSFRLSIIGSVVGWAQLTWTKLGWPLSSATTREATELFNMLTAFGAMVCTLVAAFWALRKLARWFKGKGAPDDPQPPSGRA